jgi:hypothetical protein
MRRVFGAAQSVRVPFVDWAVEQNLSGPESSGPRMTLRDVTATDWSAADPLTTLEMIMLERILPNNEHVLERMLRVVIGLGAIAMAFVGPQTPWGWVGLVPLATGILGSCPLYTLFGISTCKVRAKA